MMNHDQEAAMAQSGFHSFEDKAVRRGFIRKVFSLVVCQLIIITGSVLVTTLVDVARDYLRNTQNSDLVSGVLIASVCTYIISAIFVVCVPGLPRRYPINIILLFIITIALSLMLSVICSAFDAKVVMIALGITTLCCAGIFLFSFNTKYDLGSWQGVLFCIMWGIIITSILIPIPFSTVLMKVVAGLVALLLMLALVADIHRITGESCTSSPLSPEDYILGALQIVSDIVMIFVIILLIVALVAGSSSGGDVKCGDAGCCGPCPSCFIPMSTTSSDSEEERRRNRQSGE